MPKVYRIAQTGSTAPSRSDCLGRARDDLPQRRVAVSPRTRSTGRREIRVDGFTFRSGQHTARAGPRQPVWSPGD